MADIEAFRNNLVAAEIIDPNGTHSEFVSGKHGQKIDFDLIPDGSELYNEWVTVSADYISENYGDRKLAVVGVANGTNRTARDIGRTLSLRSDFNTVLGVPSAKDTQDSKKLYLPAETERALVTAQPELVVVHEDVGTTGSNSVQVAKAIKEFGDVMPADVVVVTTWKRQPTLPRLEEAGIEYVAIIDEPLATYDPADCVKTGFCSQGWDFKPRAK